MLLHGKLLSVCVEECRHQFGHLSCLLAQSVVLALHNYQFGCLAVGLHEVLATPHRHQSVVAAVDDSHRSLVCSGGAVDVELLCAEQVLTPQFHHFEAAHIFGWVGRVELGVEETAIAAGITFMFV